MLSSHRVAGHFARRFVVGLVMTPMMIGAADRGLVVTNLSGTFNRPQENGCIHVSLFYYRVDCSYHQSRSAQEARPSPWVGPTVNPVYYTRGSLHALPVYTPSLEDDRIAPSLAAIITIDRKGTVRGDDDTVSGILTVGPAARSLTTRADKHSNLLRAVESWIAIQHSLAETPVTSATSNAAGGFDYVVGKGGLPTRLCLAKTPGDCFPSARAPLTTDGKWGAGQWAPPGTVAIAASPALGGNVGARTTAVIDGYQCSDNSGGSECERGVALWGGVGHAGLENLLLSVSTDALGRVISINGFWTKEYRLNAGPPTAQAPEGQANSWLGGYLELRADPD